MQNSHGFRTLIVQKRIEQQAEMQNQQYEFLKKEGADFFSFFENIEPQLFMTYAFITLHRLQYPTFRKEHALLNYYHEKHSNIIKTGELCNDKSIKTKRMGYLICREV